MSEQIQLDRDTDNLIDLYDTEVDLMQARVIPRVVTLGCGVAGVMPDFPEIPLADAVDTLHDIAKKIEAIG